MRRKGSRAPLLLVLTQLILFGKKKPAEEQPSNPNPILNPDPKLEPFPIPDTIQKTVTEADITKARSRLRLANLERDIIGDALTKIYEAEAKGTISESEKNQIMQPYKSELKRVDAEIDTQRKTVDLYELEAAKEDLFKRFQETFLDIQSRIERIRPTLNLTSQTETLPADPKPVQEETEPTPATEESPRKEKPPRERPRNKAEEKIETIREEVLKAMERLEQIETEG